MIPFLKFPHYIPGRFFVLFYMYKSNIQSYKLSVEIIWEVVWGYENAED